LNSSPKPKSKSKEKDDFYVLVMPERATIRTRIANKIIEILREYPLIGEKDIILRLIIEDPEIGEYHKKTNSIAYMRSVLWDLVKKKVILKARVLGDNKHVFFFLPEQLDSLKEKIVMYPPGYTPVSINTTTTTVKTSKSPSTGAKKEEDWEEEDEEDEEDEWIEECLKNDEC
jgi:hypothetical protein